jgi:hypothetical protein
VYILDKAVWRLPQTTPQPATGPDDVRLVKVEKRSDDDILHVRIQAKLICTVPGHNCMFSI